VAAVKLNGNVIDAVTIKIANAKTVEITSDDFIRREVYGIYLWLAVILVHTSNNESHNPKQHQDKIHFKGSSVLYCVHRTFDGFFTCKGLPAKSF
jgi:hypothetical protein